MNPGQVIRRGESNPHLYLAQAMLTVLADIYKSVAEPTHSGILDEPTAMLDPNGRREVINTVMELNRKEKVTIILISHYMDEAAKADKIFVMDKGKVIMEGTPREIFSQVEKMQAIRLDVPQATELAYMLNKSGIPVPQDVLTPEELVDELCRLY